MGLDAKHECDEDVGKVFTDAGYVVAAGKANAFHTRSSGKKSEQRLRREVKRLLDDIRRDSSKDSKCFASILRAHALAHRTLAYYTRRCGALHFQACRPWGAKPRTCAGETGHCS